MAQLFHDQQQQTRQFFRCLIFALFWVSGLTAGAYIFSVSGHSNFSLMPRITSGSVSIVGLLCVSLLPFLFSAFAVMISEPRLLYPICFGKALLFSFVSMTVLVSFGSAGWLVRLLLMFSDVASLPLLFFFWLRHLSGERGFSGAEMSLMLSVFLMIGSFDYCCISPFLAML